MRGPMEPSGRTLIQRAIAVLRRFGQDAHIYLPGVGMLNGLTAANYLDSAGTTAGTVDQPVGLVLDAAGSLGVELAPVGALDFTTSTWGKNAGCGAPSANVLNFPSIGAEAVQAVTGVNSANKTFIVTVVLTGSGTLSIGVTNQIDLAVRSSCTLTGVPQTIQAFVKENSTTSTNAGLTIMRATGDTCTTATITSVSWKEVTGIAASQPTTASKPILRRGAVNLALNSKDFTQAAWSKENGSAPTATKYVEDTSNTYHRINDGGNPAPVVGQTYTYFVDASYSGRFLVLNLGATLGQKAAFDLQAGSVTQVQGSGAQILHLGSGVYRCSVTGVAIATGQKYIGTNSTASDGPYVGDGVSGVNLFGAAIFQGTYTAAQIQALGGIPTTTTAPASTALGPTYWQFDGSNDSLSLGGPLFQMADDHCVVAGVMCNAATGTAQIVASLSRDSSTGNSLARLQFDPSGTVSAAWTPTSAAAIITAPGNLTGSVKVLTAHKVGNVKRLRVGGVTAGTDSLVQTDTGMNSAAISDYRVGLQLPFNGAIYPIIGIKGTVGDADLLLLERFIGQLSGVQI